MLRRECNITPNNDGFRPEAYLGRTSVKRIPPSPPLVHRCFQRRLDRSKYKTLKALQVP